MEKNTKGIKSFLQDAKAISPAIVTLILVAVATVGAEPQQNLASPNTTVTGTLNITGSTTILPITEAAKVEFTKTYPLVVINPSGGGSDHGRLVAYTTVKNLTDIGASSAIWPDTPQVIEGITIPGRPTVVIQAGGAPVFETKFGTGLIVVAANLGSGVTKINIDNTTPCVSNFAAPTAKICFRELKDAYEGNPPVSFAGKQVIQRSDASGTEETFAKWIGLADPVTGQLISNVPGKNGNQGVRDYINSTPNTIGFVDIGFTKDQVNGAKNVIAAMMNGTAANATTAGVGKAYDQASISLTSTKKGLARDLFYYTKDIPRGAMKVYLDWILSPDGQNVVQKEGFFSISLKGDLNGNGIAADAGDLVLMKRASIGEITADSRYDLNNNGQLADAGDLVLMKRASIGEINL
jgi:phosphate transport system substrate-binding protein